MNAQNEPLEEGYFYCPECGEKDWEFFDDVLIRKVRKTEYQQLSDEQKLYINEKYEYGVHLCEGCRYKAKRKARIIKGLYVVALILLYFLPIVSFLLIPCILFPEYFLSKRDWDFKHAWDCGAVRRVS